MKIGFETISIFGHSGIETYTRSLIAALANLDEDISLELFTSFRRSEKVLEKFGHAPKINARNYFPHPLILGHLIAPFVSFYKDNFLYKKPSGKVDLFHWTNPYLYNYKMNNGAVTIHDIFPFYYDLWAQKLFVKNKDNICRRFESAFKHSRLLIVPTKQVKEEIIDNFSYINKDKIFVTYEAASDNFKNADVDYTVLEKYGLGKGSNFFLFVSRIDPRKNIQGLFAAFENLPDHIKNNFQLVVIAGGPKKKIIELKKQALEIGIGKHLLHLENIKEGELIHFYNAAYAFVFPTYAEGFGLPVIEAMQCGCPVISSNLSCIPEITGDAALLINPNSIEDIRDAMIQLAENPELRNNLIEKGLLKSKEYSWDRCAKETFSAYQWALENNK